MTVNHQMVGSGTVYLGTYYFDAGTAGYVDISNRSTGGGSVVIADMIRFGNGMGDIDRGGGVSGKNREDEAGLYWVKWHVDHSQGIPDSEYRATSNDRDATVSLSPRYAEYMNDSAAGSLSDRVFVSYHSNAGGGSARGVLGLYNGNNNPATATPNQFFLANTLANEINNDLVSLNGQFEHNWANRSTVTLDRSDIEFGEINNLRINNEFDATIIETGFHDNQQDAEMLRDPKVRDALARATYQGLIKYFRFLDPSTPNVDLPDQVSGVRAESIATGEVRVSWELPTVSGALGDVPQGYMIYASLDGYGFDGGTYVDGASSTSHVVTGLDAAEGMHYFKVAAVNAGGEAKSSEVVAAWPTVTSSKVLIVNGFDRFDRPLNPRQAYFSGEIDRVMPRKSNSFDYTVQVGAAVEAYADQLSVDASSNESVIDGSVSLSDYDAVVWILGEESTVDDTFSATEQSLVTSYLNAGGKLFVSGAEIGWDLDSLNNGRSFYNDQLRANYVSDDANTYDVIGVPGSIFSGLNFSFDDGSLFYDAQFPDRITSLNGSLASMTYLGGSGGTAAIQYGTVDSTQVVMFGFPFETITDSSQRNAVMDRVLEFFGIPITDIVDGDFDDDGDLDCDDVDALTAEIASGGTNLLFDVNGSGTISQADLDFWISDLKGTLPGDANLDFVVDGGDFIEWNSHKFTSTGTWCSADFNADGVTDGQDFVIWNDNKFTSAPVGAALPAMSPAAASDSRLNGQTTLQGAQQTDQELSVDEGRSNGRATRLSGSRHMNPPRPRSYFAARQEARDKRDQDVELQRFDVLRVEELDRTLEA